MILETKRLILRPPRKTDWKDVVEGVSDIEVSKNLLVVPHPYRKKDAVKWISSSVKKWKDKKKENYVFFIELKSEKKVIGVTDLHKIDKFQGVANTGSWINKNYWRNGYILEAKIPVLDFAFNKLRLRKIETTAFSDNLASNGMSRKLGFKLEGTKRKSAVAKSNGKIHDGNIYGLLKEEWLKRRGRLVKELSKRTERSK